MGSEAERAIAFLIFGFGAGLFLAVACFGAISGRTFTAVLGGTFGIIVAGVGIWLALWGG